MDPWGLNGKSIGTEDNPFGSSRAARRDAMRQEGIPISQQPLSQSKNKSGREYTYSTQRKQGGGMTISSVQDQAIHFVLACNYLWSEKYHFCLIGLCSGLKRKVSNRIT